MLITAEFHTTPIAGAYVTGTRTITHPSGRTKTATFGGIYEGVRPSEHTGQPMHHFRDGILGNTAQTRLALPVDQFPRPLMEVLSEHVAEVQAARA